MSKKIIDIEKYEQDILNDLDNNAFISVENLDEEMALAKQAASNYMKKNNRVNVRISGSDLNMIRKLAVQEGLPYQTFLSSIIHKFAAGRLVDRIKYA
jgi:predicted DNA binding CopG/RHH family protein